MARSDNRRSFNAQERLAVEVVSGSTGKHADHIKPFSKGGATSVENCQLIDGVINRKKGAFEFIPRDWQRDFLFDWQSRTEGAPFLLIAIPGCGKTMAALEACREWMAAGADRRIFIVVPTDNLRQQWRDEAVRFGLDLQTKDFGTNFNRGFTGGVVTYQLVSSPQYNLVFRRICSASPTMVVFDEVHHCGDDSTFGSSVKNAFELAQEKLLMSGTPWKSDGQAIPYVKYDNNGFPVDDFRYEYSRALAEGVVRHVVFQHEKGAITDDLTGERDELSSETSDEEARKRLRKLLDPSGDYVRSQIKLAHRKLIECRKSVPDAASLAVCIDQQHARAVANVVHKVTGCKPSVIVSDEQLSTDTVKAFRSAKTEWLVAVRQVSEGTDIKRLQVLCYLTNTTAELFFRQVIGRVSRIRGVDDDQAYVYLPADPRLIRCAQNIENAQVQGLREREDRKKRELEPADADDVSGFGSYSTEHGGTDVVLVGSQRIPVAEAARIESIAAQVGISMKKVMHVMQLSGTSRNHQSVAGTGVVEKSKEERMDELRRKCHRAAAKLALKKGIDFSEVHGKFRPQSEMSEEELKSKLADICRWSKEVTK